MTDTDASIDSSNLAYIEALYETYLHDRSAVSPEWAEYFAAQGNGSGEIVWRRQPQFRPRSVFNPLGGAAGVAVNGERVAILQDKVDQLVRAYRVRGHTVARIDPLDQPRPPHPELEIEHFGLTDEILDMTFSSDTIAGPGRLTLREIIQRLRNTYCRSIGVEFMHIDDIRVKNWLLARMEATQNRLSLSLDQQIAILTRLTDAVMFEEFMQTKYIGAKRFSLEGGESLIPLLHLALNRAAEYELNGVVIGMPHRGRLNVLANIIGKSTREIFQDFEDLNPQFTDNMGDVKYHLGYGSTWIGQNGHELHVSLCFNPSHLEIVDPVALGRTRANVDRYSSPAAPKGMCILIHGDAAFAGQGIIQEILNFSQLPAYSVGGTLHVIVNNQVGFTTDPKQGRGTQYATDVAKMLQIPILHVNGEDPEAVAQAVMLAMDFRHQFLRDVVIDMYCYRRRGHNEGDEPSFTQPLMYRKIKEKQSVREIYRDRLIELGEITHEMAEGIAVRQRQELDEALSEVRSEQPIRPNGNLGELWNAYHGGPQDEVVEVTTAVEAERLQWVLERLTQLPEGFTPHRKIARWLEHRRQMAAGEQPLDWSAAETLAFATTSMEGLRVRLTGQDSERGTFSHRHAVLHDYETGETYAPLQHLSPQQAPVEIHNSPLSEAGVLGYEYGYSLDFPDGLVLWEAQFGDFCNAAQVIIDQFIASAEDKWGYFSGLVLLLPHGYEGMGPEHSSARLERFLLLAADDNLQIVQPTTPAQFFHCLRRQVISRWRKPLVVMTPKSLLRHPKVVSTIEDCAVGRFHRVLWDPRRPAYDKVRRVLLTSGKLYYELDEYRSGHQREDVAIMRLEQLYPLATESLLEAVDRYSEDIPVTWVQEEPENMGACYFLKRRYCDGGIGRHPLDFVSRKAAASPATGSASQHLQQQQQLIKEAFGD